MAVGPQLYDLERRFWEAAGDREAYASLLEDDALHILPGMGILAPDEVLEGVEAATPWSAYDLDERHAVRLGDDAVALVYTARASRPGQAYAAAVTSVYRRDRGRWRLVVHQQTPLETW